MAGTTRIIGVTMMNSTMTLHTAIGIATTSITGIITTIDGTKTGGESLTMDPMDTKSLQDITTIEHRRIAWGTL